jgi:hypothetical protein
MRCAARRGGWHVKGLVRGLLRADSQGGLGCDRKDATHRASPFLFLLCHLGGQASGPRRHGSGRAAARWWQGADRATPPPRGGGQRHPDGPRRGLWHAAGVSFSGKAGREAATSAWSPRLMHRPSAGPAASGRSAGRLGATKSRKRALSSDSPLKKQHGRLGLPVLLGIGTSVHAFSHCTWTIAYGLRAACELWTCCSSAIAPW